MKNPALCGFCAVFLALLAGCGSAPTLDLGQSGKSLSYTLGTAAFDIEAVPATDGVDVLISIPPTSLTFLQSFNTYRADYEIALRLYDATGTTLLSDRAWAESTVVPTYEETRRSEALLVEKDVAAAPGSHLLVVSITDNGSGQSAERRQLVDVPDPNAIRPMLGRIVLESRDRNSVWRPVVPLHVSAQEPGLRATVRLYGLAKGVTADVAMRLSRFHINDAPAAPPQDFTLIPGIDETRRLNLESPDTVRAERFQAGSDSASRILHMDLQGLASSLYAVSVEALVHGNGVQPDTVLRGMRAVSIKPPTFPRPSTMDELIHAMVYILRDRDRERFRAAKTRDERKAVFDSLWLSFAPNPTEASALIRRYYTRVEEANRMFTDLKEGWKTDRGMLYIVLGPPSNTLNSLDTQTWYYEIPGVAQTAAFVFKRVILGEGELSVQKYVLLRSMQYERFWDTMTDKWREDRAW